MGYCTVTEVEDLIEDQIWASADTAPDPSVQTVQEWIDRFSAYVDSRLRPSVDVPLDETNDPDAYAECKDIVALLTAGRLIQRLKFHQSGDENVAMDWIREARTRITDLASGLAETDAPTSRNNIRSLEVDVDDADLGMVTMQGVDY